MKANSRQKNWKSVLKGGLSVSLVLGTLALSNTTLAGEDAAAHASAFQPKYGYPHYGDPYDRGVDPFRSIVEEAAWNSGEVLKTTKNITVKRGANLMDTLLRAGLERREAYYAIEALSETFNPRKIRAGQTLTVDLETRKKQGKTEVSLVQILMPMDFGEELVVKRGADGLFTSEMDKIPTRSVKMYAEGTIADSLYLSALSEGVPLGVVSEMIRLFSFDVDFQREIWSGDGFKVFYERRLTPDGQVENTGKVLAASLILRGKELTFYRYEGADGKVDYYTADGKSARKMLMKTPIDGARLSSRFGSRKHPVLGYTRMHKGVDFAAVTGTPIMAAGDGVIERASAWGSFGNYIRIRHNGTYQTAYAHLSGYARGIRTGVRVKQGQIIGYVGATGRVTGAHLHYEIHKDGTQINPLNLKMPKGESLVGTNLLVLQAQVAEFEAETGLIRAFLAIQTPIDPDLKALTIGD